jgi:hypothetical protein
MKKRPLVLRGFFVGGKMKINYKGLCFRLKWFLMPFITRRHSFGISIIEDN